MKASWQAHAAAFLVRLRVKPALGDLSDIARVRKVFDQPLPAPAGVRYTPAELGGVAGEWVQAAQGPPADTTLLYLHGGGFVGCSPRSHRSLTAALALQGLRLFVPDYRLAPEHPFPAAPRDVLAVWRALRDEVDGRIGVAGDSAGGNLALGLMLTLRDAGLALPDAAVLFSPAADLTGGSASLFANAERDPMFRGPDLDHLADAYMAGADRAQPLASPLLGDLHGLPPLLLQVGQTESLRDDSLRLADKARAAGVQVDLQVFPVVPHVWQLLTWLPEARRAVQSAAAFLRRPPAAARPAPRPLAAEPLDLVIVGAGLAGIGAAVHLQRECPDRRVALLEAGGAIGGTWNTFRFPGVRSDSDMHTLAYDFKPWTRAQAIVDGETIRNYIAEAAAEHGIDRQVRLHHRVLGADWSSARGLWTLQVAQGERAEPATLQARFVLFCSGYFRHAAGWRPSFPDERLFAGTWVHPQAWPPALDLAGRRVVVIGSGATAVTLLPQLARSAAHVTLLQRSPSYVFARPSRDAVAAALLRWLPARWAASLVRWKNIGVGLFYYRFARRHPQRAKARLIELVRRQLGPGFDVERHFTPAYAPWDQRVCLAPDGDLFRVLREGRADIVTDRIAGFGARTVRLASGAELAADVIVSATGLQLNLLGDARISVDGQPRDLSRAFVYKGLMLSGIPNLAGTFGYVNASWTLKADLGARWLARLLKHMARRGRSVATPVADPALRAEPLLPLSSGYVQRAAGILPRQGDRRPWRLHQNYLHDWVALRWGRVDDGVLRLDPAPATPARKTQDAAAQAAQETP